MTPEFRLRYLPQQRGSIPNSESILIPQALPAVDPRGLGSPVPSAQPEESAQPLTPRFGESSVAAGGGGDVPPPPGNRPMDTPSEEPDYVGTASSLTDFFTRDWTTRNVEYAVDQSGDTRMVMDNSDQELPDPYLTVVFEQAEGISTVFGFSVKIPDDDGPIVLINDLRKVDPQEARSQGYGTAALDSFERSLALTAHGLRKDIELVFNVSNPNVRRWLEDNGYEPEAANIRGRYNFRRTFTGGNERP